MKVSLVTSLHLNHAYMSPDSRPGDQLRMQSFVPMGLLSLKATAEQAGLDCDIRVTELNALVNRGVVKNSGRFYDSLAEAVLEHDDKLVGLMTDADFLHHTLAIADVLKRRSPHTLICLGGPAASPIGRSIIEAFPYVDLVVRGEGELTFVELLQDLDNGSRLAGVRGLVWRNGDRGIENPERELIQDLDTLPIALSADYEMDPEAALYLDVGRGCPFSCSFCATAPFWRRKFRMKSISRIIQEMTLVRDQYGRRHVNFSHDIFTCDREWTRRFCDELVNSNLQMTWTCSTRTDLNNKDLIDRMAAAGCVEIYYGIESGSQAGQGKIRKNLDLNESREVVRSTAEAGIRPITGFIVGYPMETLEAFGSTLEGFFEFLDLGEFRAHLFPLCPYHDSAILREFQHEAHSPAECFDLPLCDTESARTGVLKRQEPFVFASGYRYASPEVSSRLIAASEELSPKLVLLRSLWPRLLPMYDSALDWYTRWVDWIEAHNAKARPATPWPHQGDAGDLLAFIGDELSRFNLTQSSLADLVRYERLKLDASSLKCPQPTHHQLRDPPQEDTIIATRPDYVSAPFRYDIKAMLSGKQPAQHPDERWIVCHRDSQGNLSTIELPALAMLVLQIASEPRTIASLHEVISADIGGPDPQKVLSFENSVSLVQQLLQHDLLEEVLH